MAAPENFAAFILTHGRPGRVYTFPLLRDAGYTGPVYLLVDDEDADGDEYRRLYGDRVVTFSKAAIAERFDEGDNFGDRRTVVYARNACWDAAEWLGVRYFIQLDDDYDAMWYKFDSGRDYGNFRIRSLDAVLSALVEFLSKSGALCVAMAQMGDFQGGRSNGDAQTIWLKRKAMNTFVCDAERPFRFLGRVNEDVNTYTSLGGMGGLFFQVYQLAINQKQTQASAGGMTEMYLDSGTYVKSFYPVMWSPSSVRVGVMGNNYARVHHRISWANTVPCIVAERYRRGDA